jgi:NADPH2 dehydrogenase
MFALPTFVRLGGLRTATAFRERLAALGLELPCDDAILTAETSPLAQPLSRLVLHGRSPGNRYAIQPMEGWDATPTGAPTDDVRRRWQRFGLSGAKLIWGGEAMAVRPDGRANPNQLILSEENRVGIAELVTVLKSAHGERYGTTDDLLIGFQLTHSGRFCRPHDKRRWEPRVAYRHPLLDARFGVTSDDAVLPDDALPELVRDFVRAAQVAHAAGADFVDLKHCHGYLLHEFLGAHTRPGPYGGSFENRTRLLREIVAGIRADGNPIGLGVRLSAFDLVPHRPDPALSQPGKPGPGIPEDASTHLPYRYGFGLHPDRPTETDLTEPLRFLALLGELGIPLLNASAGSPYYTPHLLRPAAFPPSDGYQPAHDPLVEVVRQIQTVRTLRAQAPAGLTIVGSGYTYLQEFLPHVAQAVLRAGWVDAVGLGRMVLSYPEFLADALAKGAVETRGICRTFSDCTTAPRNGLPSGCYPLDRHYTGRPDHAVLKRIKQTGA